MTESYLQQTALAHRHLKARKTKNSAVEISECLNFSQTIIRGSSSNQQFNSGIKKVTSLSLPKKPCTSVGKVDDIRIIWMGPNEWLLVSPQSKFKNINKQLRTSFEGIHSSIVNVDDGRTILGISGIKARETLMKGCSIDLHPQYFKLNSATNTLLAQTQIILQKLYT